MAKLIFEDNNGDQHELQIKSIPTKSLKPNDILMVDCEIGKDNPPSKQINDFMVKVRDMFQSYFPKNKVIVQAMRGGKKDINLKIIKEK